MSIMSFNVNSFSSMSMPGSRASGSRASSFQVSGFQSSGIQASNSTMDSRENMRGLNTRLADYLAQVRALQEANSKLENQIKERVSSRTTGERDWTQYDQTISLLREQLNELTMENGSLMLQIDNARLAADDFKVKFEAENGVRQGVDQDVVNLRKILDDTHLSRMQLESEVESLKEELIHLNRNHDEDVANLRGQIQGSSVDVQMEAKKGDNLSETIDRIRQQYEKTAQKSREETEAWYQAKFDSIAAEVSRSTETLQQDKSEVNDLRREKQVLEIDLQSLRTMNHSLEDNLNDMAGRYAQEMNHHNTIIQQLEAELGEIHAQVGRQRAEYQALLNIKTKLEEEISAYHHLLEGTGVDDGFRDTEDRKGGNVRGSGTLEDINVWGSGTHDNITINIRGSGTWDDANIKAPGTRDDTNIKGPGTRDDANIKGPGKHKDTNIKGPGTRDDVNIKGPGKHEDTNIKGPGTRDDVNIKGPGKHEDTNIKGPGTRDDANIKGPGKHEDTNIKGPGTRDDVNIKGSGKHEDTNIKGPGTQDDTNFNGTGDGGFKDSNLGLNDTNTDVRNSGAAENDLVEFSLEQALNAAPPIPPAPPLPTTDQTLVSSEEVQEREMESHSEPKLNTANGTAEEEKRERDGGQKENVVLEKEESPIKSVVDVVVVEEEEEKQAKEEPKADKEPRVAEEKMEVKLEVVGTDTVMLQEKVEVMPSQNIGEQVE